ncbi:steroid 17-alpha-hydroxylase/17,20 lyase [Pseudoliparis swirei]|uniref:steroid 17-alpha-hydroxylase/17,20 lyase n=1 Tax=Pseudoliparis swirei TaxID=2059687 RepID=UPI0024BF0825|nr:steroid 17-alpha-hydroxylase/17,20 lyase [Pseudoliparis swirei]
MFPRLLSSLPAFVSFPLSFSPSLVLLVIFLVATVVFLTAVQTAPPASGAQGWGSVPCLPRLPVLGSLPWLGGGLPPHLLFSQLAHRYGSLFALYLGPHYTLVVNSHQHAREVLLQRGRDFAGRPSMVTTDLLTRGGKDIAFSDYSPLWKSHRRLVHDSFTLFGEGSDRLQDIGTGDPCRDLSVCPQVFPIPSLRRLKACISVRDRLLSRKLQEHQASLSDGDPRDLLDALLKGQAAGGPQPISEDHVLMTAAEAFGAGVETTSTTLRWLLVYLLHHPEVQERVQKELDEQVGGARPVCVADRGRLPYLDCVINEGLRIRPVSPVLIPHTAMADSSIGGHAVRRGTRVLVNMWAIHHDPEHWDRPDLFHPDRFLDAGGRRVSPSCFLPFGAGPRVCVGESLARLELFLFLSSLLQRLSFTLPRGASPPNLQGRLGVVLQPLPYTVVVTPRAGWEGGAK